MTSSSPTASTTPAAAVIENGIGNIGSISKMLHVVGANPVVTSPVNHTETRIKNLLLELEQFDSGGSLNVGYMYTFADIPGSYLRRYWYFRTFFFLAGRKALQLRRPDVIYVDATPRTVRFLGALRSSHWCARLFFDVTDVWPDAAIEVGVLRSEILIAAARLRERFTYAASARILCLMDGIRTNIRGKNVPEPKLSVVTNGVDLALLQEHSALAATSQRLRGDWDAKGKFVCVYIGEHGVYNALHIIIDAAIAVREDSRILLVLVGEGNVKATLQARAVEAGLRNVQFLGVVPRSETPGVLSAADCFLLPILRGAFYDLNLPNKFFRYLASGAPILVIGSCEAGRIVQAARTGEVLPVEDGAALATAIVALADAAPTLREAAGSQEHAVARDRYSREAVFHPLLDLLEQTS